MGYAGAFGLNGGSFGVKGGVAGAVRLARRFAAGPFGVNAGVAGAVRFARRFAAHTPAPHPPQWGERLPLRGEGMSRRRRMVLGRFSA
jgi:hypothetical protein